MNDLLKELGDLEGFEEEIRELEMEEAEDVGEVGGEGWDEGVKETSEESVEWCGKWRELMQKNPEAIAEAILANHDEDGEEAVDSVLVPMTQRIHAAYGDVSVGEFLNGLNDAEDMIEPSHKVIGKKFILLALLTMPEEECALVDTMRKELYVVNPGLKTFVAKSAPQSSKVGKSEEIEDFVEGFMKTYRMTCL